MSPLTRETSTPCSFCTHVFASSQVKGLRETVETAKCTSCFSCDDERATESLFGKNIEKSRVNVVLFLYFGSLHCNLFHQRKQPYKRFVFVNAKLCLVATRTPCHYNNKALMMIFTTTTISLSTNKERTRERERERVCVCVGKGRVGYLDSRQLASGILQCTPIH